MAVAVRNVERRRLVRDFLQPERRAKAFEVVFKCDKFRSLSFFDSWFS